MLLARLALFIYCTYCTYWVFVAYPVHTKQRRNTLPTLSQRMQNSCRKCKIQPANLHLQELRRPKREIRQKRGFRVSLVPSLIYVDKILKDKIQLARKNANAVFELHFKKWVVWAFLDQMFKLAIFGQFFLLSYDYVFLMTYSHF